MTDEQIIKAFEEIIKNQNNKLSLIEQAVCADVLSLIKRTKDEGNKHRNKYQAVKAEFTRLYDTVCCQKAEIGELKAITGIMNTRKYYRKFVDEVFEKEMGNMRMSPDFDYIYELYFKQRAEIERLSQKLQQAKYETTHLKEILEERKKVKKWIPRTCCRAKIHRLRLQIQEVMLRIERKCEGSFKRVEGERWE